jgi:putative ABC transport system permease protein
MQSLLQDLRYSARQLIKDPGITLTAVISLALAIGAATAVFSVIYAVLMNPHPYPAADRIVRLTTQSVAGSADPVYLNGDQIQTLRWTWKFLFAPRLRPLRCYMRCASS